EGAGQERRRAVGGVHHHVQAVQRGAPVRAPEVVEVGAAEVARLHAPRVEQGLAGQGRDDLLGAVLHLGAELAARAAEDLDAVVLVWVVGGGDHHAQVVAAAAATAAQAAQGRV